MSKGDCMAVMCPPILDGSNYVIWKAKMKMHLMIMDGALWEIILCGWTKPSKIYFS